MDYFSKIFTVESKPINFCESEILQKAFDKYREEYVKKLPCVETVRKYIIKSHLEHKMMIARKKFRFSSINFDIWTLYGFSFLIVTGFLFFLLLFFCFFFIFL
jgi:hypothetical protein